MWKDARPRPRLGPIRLVMTSTAAFKSLVSICFKLIVISKLNSTMSSSFLEQFTRWAPVYLKMVGLRTAAKGYFRQECKALYFDCNPTLPVSRILHDPYHSPVAANPLLFSTGDFGR